MLHSAAASPEIAQLQPDLACLSHMAVRSQPDADPPTARPHCLAGGPVQAMKAYASGRAKLSRLSLEAVTAEATVRA